MTLAHEIAWTAGARCAGQPSEMFYANTPGGNYRNDPALVFCNDAGGCPARRHCLAYAIANNERTGTWGGMLQSERNDFARTRCSDCFTMLGRPLIAAMVRDGRQHTHCPTCAAWVEVVPYWERPRRNSWVTGTGRRT